MPPSFISPKRSVMELEYGSSANITCNANGMPRPRVRWHEGVCAWVFIFNIHSFFNLKLVLFTKQGLINN